MLGSGKVSNEAGHAAARAGDTAGGGVATSGGVEAAKPAEAAGASAAASADANGAEAAGASTHWAEGLAPVESYARYREITRAARKRFGRGIGNCTLMPAEAKELAEAGLLSYAACDDALFLLRSRPDYDQLYFTIADHVAGGTESVVDHVATSAADRTANGDATRTAGAVAAETAETVADQPDGKRRKIKNAQRATASDLMRELILKRAGARAVVCELPYFMQAEDHEADVRPCANLPEATASAMAFLESAGFSIRRTSARYAAVAGTRISATPTTEVAALPIALRDEGLSLVREHFDIYCDYIPREEEWDDALAEGRVIAITATREADEHETDGREARDRHPLDQNIRETQPSPASGQNIVGLLHYDVDGDSSELRHLIVSPAHRGRGAAGKLVTTYLEHCARCGLRSYLWMRVGNDTALHVYERCGYTYDGVQAIEMIAIPKEC